VAAPALKRVTRIAGKALAWVALALGLIMLAAWIGSAIPRNGDWQEPTDGIELMLETNGFHTAIVMPVVTPIKDWRETFPSAARATPSGAATHIAVGWGEEEVFLHTPTWWDLKPGAVARILTTGGTGIMRVSPYVRPAPSEWHRPFKVTPAQYAELVRIIENAVVPPNPDGTRTVLRDVYSDDDYYRARGRYTLWRTCNQWVSNTLAEAGVKTGWWTPFASGVTKWVPLPEENSDAGA
jgi:uncharacterized protein (TIGR02117 family)